jgi:hypothetical protein
MSDRYPGGVTGRVSGLLLSACLLAGIALAACALGLWLATRDHGQGSPPASSRSAPPPLPSSPARATPSAGGEAPLSPAAIRDLRALSVSSLSATIAWRTAAPTSAWVAAGPPDAGPLLWWRQERPARRHLLVLDGLAFSTPYRIWVSAVAASGERGQASLDLVSAGPPSAAATAVHGGAVTLDGQPFFPLFVWGGCPETYETSLQAGLTVFVRNPCGGLPAQVQALAGRALSAAVAGEETAAGGPVVGTFYPDEADAHGLRRADLALLRGPGLRILTLSNHFYSGAAPLPQGRAMYPGLVAEADVVGFDLYPLQEWCRPDRLADVYAAQQELARLAAGKPTFQWIEAAGMRCPNGATAVTPQTVWAEAWLAVAGGARGLGFFPPAAWTGEVGEAIAAFSRLVRYLTPVLVSTPLPAVVEPAGGAVKAAAWERQGALYAVAVNASRAPLEAAIRIPGLADRPVSVIGEGRTLGASGGAIEDLFPPLGVHLYVAAPPGG